PDAAAKALTGVTVPADYALQVPDPEATDAYPIVSLTWLLLYEQPQEPAKAKALIEFLKWAYTDGKQYANELGYLPVPDELVTKILGTLDTIKVAAK
ncbi:MAG: phosphate ABC transporter substrate-binding protein PstS, partial [Phormidesmis sp. CAN_BIN36]|nr:phosphate ABC transporter substrate-binding protein PstS [Phormidesmis sp. CAN_BIN36]